MGKTHWSGPLLSDNRALGGAAAEMHIDATAGEGDMITTFDDFDDVVNGIDTFAGAGIFEDSSWVLTDDPTTGGTGEQISMNDPASGDLAEWAPSCLRIFAGTVDDGGGNMQLDHVNGAYGTELTEARFPHLWIPDTTHGTEVLDNTIWTFGCRIGLRADLTTTGSGDWNTKVFLGWAAAGDVSVMDHDTGVITTTAGNLHGLHIPEDGSIDGISRRITGDALVDGTNFTELVAAGGVDGTVANGATTIGDTMWFDLALRMTITDMSDDAANGATEFFVRKVNSIGTGKPGQAGANLNGWGKISTVLLNETPNHTIALVPTIEVINGPTADRDGVFYLDWWTFGCSRRSRISR